MPWKSHKTKDACKQCMQRLHLRFPRPMSCSSGSGGCRAAALAASSSACDSRSSASRQYAAPVLLPLHREVLYSLF